MDSKKYINQRGSGIIEIIFTISLFLIFVGGIAGLLARQLDTLSLSNKNLYLVSEMKNSFEAIRQVANQNWSLISDGVYGLTTSTNSWVLAGTPDVNGTITREVTISTLNRDTECNVVDIGGVADDDSKYVSISLTDNAGGKISSLEYSSIITRSDEPTFCLSQGDANNLVLDVEFANIDSTKKSLVGIILRNAGNTPITLDKMTLEWDKPGNINYIKIESENHWHSTNGTGTPQGSQPSGTELDLVNLTLEAGEDYDIDIIRFDSKVDGSTFTIKATLSDGSSKTEVTSPPFTP